LLPSGSPCRRRGGAPSNNADLRLQITLGDRHRTVDLYDPDELKSDERARRFLVTWKTAFAHVPLRPAW
jgi:hypothetical protein